MHRTVYEVTKMSNKVKAQLNRIEPNEEEEESQPIVKVIYLYYYGNLVFCKVILITIHTSNLVFIQTQVDWRERNTMRQWIKQLIFAADSFAIYSEIRFHIVSRKCC